MWNIFKRNKNHKLSDVCIDDSKCMQLLYIIKERGFTNFHEMIYSFQLEFIYPEYYYKKDKWGNTLLLGFNGRDIDGKFGAYFICTNGMQEYMNFSYMQIYNPEKTVDFIESYFHRKYGWENNLEK